MYTEYKNTLIGGVPLHRTETSVGKPTNPRYTPE